MLIESGSNNRGKVMAIFVPILVSVIAIFSRCFFSINILPLRESAVDEVLALNALSIALSFRWIIRS
jgi:hypothetical protein